MQNIYFGIENLRMITATKKNGQTLNLKKSFCFKLIFEKYEITRIATAKQKTNAKNILQVRSLKAILLQILKFGVGFSKN